jgi:hypothetical protein
VAFRSCGVTRLVVREGIFGLSHLSVYRSMRAGILTNEDRQAEIVDLFHHETSWEQQQQGDQEELLGEGRRT